MRRFLKYALIPVAIAALYAVWKAEQPMALAPAADWEATVTSEDFTTRSFFVPVDGAVIEAMILVPNKSEGPFAAVIFSGGSGDGLFQNYAPGFLKNHIQDVFLPRGIAVAYANKRGMGASTGNWKNNSIAGRARDLRAVADAVRAMPDIDAARVGLAGHSQGGWVVVRAVTEDPSVAFVLNLMGPLRTPWDQFEFMWHTEYSCRGMTGEKLRRAEDWKARVTRIGMAIGRVVPIGTLEFDAKHFKYETSGLLAQVRVPLLSLYGGYDPLVDGAASEAFLRAEFPQGVPGHLEAVTVPATDHSGLLAEDICDWSLGRGHESVSPEVAATITNWLSRIGY